jgi:hypothetical protein
MQEVSAGVALLLTDAAVLAVWYVVAVDGVDVDR